MLIISTIVVRNQIQYAQDRNRVIQALNNLVQVGFVGRGGFVGGVNA